MTPTPQPMTFADEIANAVPTSWLDSLLTGPDRVAEFKDGQDVEALLRAVKKRVRQAAAATLTTSEQRIRELEQKLDLYRTAIPAKDLRIGELEGQLARALKYPHCQRCSNHSDD